MKKTPHYYLLLASGAIFLFAACKDDDMTVMEDDNTIIERYLNIDIENPNNYSLPAYPAHYDDNILINNDNTPANNPVTDDGATLGRVLFYDKKLSLNNTVACASCHKQSMGFTDEHQLSPGFEGALTGAHSMRLANARFYRGINMFWDKRADDLEDQSTMPIKDHNEMGYTAEVGGIDSLIRKMRALEYYPILFENAFGDDEISESRMQLAIAQFIRSMVSVNSKFDEGFSEVFNPNAPNAGIGADFPNFSTMENMGKNLFLTPPNQNGAGCAGCHQVPTLSLAANSLSNGLDLNETIVFKSPSLKNVGITGPYMHDGRFTTLSEVVEHYNSGIQDGPTLDNRLRGPMARPLRLNLSNEEKDALVAFLNTLTDNSVTTDVKFSDPFK